MDELVARKVQHAQARDNYRVTLKDEAGEVEIGSVGLQTFTSDDTGWTWGIDTVIPMRVGQTSGRGRDQADCLQQFRAAWDRLTTDRGWREEFLQSKRLRRPPSLWPNGKT